MKRSLKSELEVCPIHHTDRDFDTKAIRESVENIFRTIFSSKKNLQSIAYGVLDGFLGDPMRDLLICAGLMLFSVAVLWLAAISAVVL